jgi:hypothetical protein
MRRLDTGRDEVTPQEQVVTQARAEILRLARSQRATLGITFADLLGDGGPPDETADEMIQAIRKWRDTPSNSDVVSFLYKRDTRAKLYEPHLNDPPFILSFMSLAELRRWTLERNWGKEGGRNWKSISRDT